MHGDKLGAVGKGRFHLNIVDHFRNPRHHLRPGQHLRAGLHQIGHGAAVARALDDEIGNDGDGFGMVELDAALQPPSRHHGRHRNQKLVLFAGRQIHESTLLIPADPTQLSHSRGSADPEARPSTAIMSARSLAASWAQKRAIANPFRVETPTSPPKDFESSRILATSASSPGTINAVPTAALPFAIAGLASLSPMSPSSRTVSANTSLPPRRIRQRSTNSPCSIRSPIAERPNTTISQSKSEALCARSISIRRDTRAPSNKMVSCGSQARCEPAAAFKAIVSSAPGPSVR